MPLNLNTSDGEFTPYLKYNAKAGRFYAKMDNVPEEIEISNPRLAFDMAGIKTGWIFFQEGVGPEKVWDPDPATMAARPPGPRKFKRGFEVQVYGANPLPGSGAILGTREFSSTAGVVITSILEMYAAYEAGVAINPGKVPVYVCRGVKPITGSYGTNYQPNFVLEKWVDAHLVKFHEQEQAQPSRQTRAAAPTQQRQNGQPPRQTAPPQDHDYPNNRQDEASYENSDADPIPF